MHLFPLIQCFGCLYYIDHGGLVLHDQICNLLRTIMKKGCILKYCVYCVFMCFSYSWLNCSLVCGVADQGVSLVPHTEIFAGSFSSVTLSMVGLNIICHKVYKLI